MKKIFFLLFAFVLMLGVSSRVSAWVGPMNQPPNCSAGQQGCDVPVHVGDSQNKNGRLQAGATLPYPAGNPNYVNGGPRGVDQPTTLGLTTPSRVAAGAFCFWIAGGLLDCKNSWSEIGGGGGSLWEEIRSGWIQPKSAISQKGVNAKYGFILETRTDNPSVTSADAGRMWLCTDPTKFTTTCGPN